MNSELEVYKFSLEALENMVDSVDNIIKKCNDINKDNSKYIEEIKININILKKNIMLSNDLENNITNLEQSTKILRDTIIKNCNKMNEIIDSSKVYLSVDIKNEDIDIFNKYIKLLNDSFWDARYQVSELGIKYPSNLYEKMVKEYQNKYLIDKNNITLEELNNKIDFYKEKLENK